MKANGLFLLAVLSLSSTSKTFGAGLVNGDFESPSAPPNWFYNYGPGNTPPSFGWQVVSGDIDLLGGGYWQASSGQQSVDLNGYTTGSLYQDFTFAAGGYYVIKFDLSANPDLSFVGDGLGTGIKQMRMDFGPVGSMASLGTFGVDSAPRSVGNMDYVLTTSPTIGVTANTTYRLQFTSLESGSGGPVIDNVRVELVPEPSTITLFSLAGLGVFIHERKRTR